MQRPTRSVQFLSYFVPLGITSIFMQSSAYALPCRTISSSQAEGLEGKPVDLKVGPGFGLNILVPEQETVEDIWLDDMSQIGVASNGRLCQWSSQGQPNCQNEGVSILHLRQIEKINFPNLPRSADGSTLLTLIPTGAQKRKIYHFKVTPTSKSPGYQCIVIQPDSDRSAPLASQLPAENPTNTSSITDRVPPTASLPIPQLKQESLAGNLNTSPLEPNQSNSNTINASAVLTHTPQSRENSQNFWQKRAINSSTTPAIQKSLDDVSAARKGLSVAKSIGLDLKLKPQLRAIKAIGYLEKGLSIEEAAEKSGLHVTLLNQLIVWGRYYQHDLVSSY